MPLMESRYSGCAYLTSSLNTGAHEAGLIHLFWIVSNMISKPHLKPVLRSMHVHLPLILCGHMEGVIHLAVAWLAAFHHCTGPFRRRSSTLQLDTAHKSPFDRSIICYWLFSHVYTLAMQDNALRQPLCGGFEHSCVVALNIAVWWLWT